jgi:hypothetical protein
MIFVKYKLVINNLRNMEFERFFFLFFFFFFFLIYVSYPSLALEGIPTPFIQSLVNMLKKIYSLSYLTQTD